VEALAESVGQYGSKLLDARLQEVDDDDGLALLRADFLAHALEARGARLQVGDADDVLVGHPQREVARHFGGELLVAAEERLHALLVERRVFVALVILQSLNAEIHDLSQLAGALRRRRRRGRRALARGDVVAGGEAAQAGLGAAAAVADGLLA